MRERKTFFEAATDWCTDALKIATGVAVGGWLGSTPPTESGQRSRIVQPSLFSPQRSPCGEDIVTRSAHRRWLPFTCLVGVTATLVIANSVQNRRNSHENHQESYTTSR